LIPPATLSLLEGCQARPEREGFAKYYLWNYRPLFWRGFFVERRLLMEFDTHTRFGALLSINCASSEVPNLLEQYGGPEAFHDLSLLSRENGTVHVSGWISPPKELSANEGEFLTSE